MIEIETNMTLRSLIATYTGTTPYVVPYDPLRYALVVLNTDSDIDISPLFQGNNLGTYTAMRPGERPYVISYRDYGSAVKLAWQILGIGIIGTGTCRLLDVRLPTYNNRYIRKNK